MSLRRRLTSPVRVAAVALALLLAWEAVVLLAAPPHYILPGPGAAIAALFGRFQLIMGHAWVTAAEMVLGLLLGVGAGCLAAIAMAYWTRAYRWLMPALVASQAIPVFAMAPILVLWLDYGMSSKVAMAGLIIFFPVAAALLDGLKGVNPGWLELAQSMGAGPWRTLLHIRLPASIPAFGSGLRVAASVAPIGAVVGEWVGSSAGLGHLMLHANARLQTDVMFAALLTLIVLAASLYFTVDRLLRRAERWARGG